MGIGACIRSAPQSGHIALVLITDDLGIVARIGYRVAVMYAGEIVEAATAEALFRDPRHPYTRGLIGCIPVPGRTRPGETLGVIPDVVPTLISDLVERRACLRALPAAAHDGRG